MEIFFSVIMPTYNQAPFIRRAILSLYEQTYSNWELIIINDGSTDETEMFISDLLTRERVVYLKNEFNQGLGFALNQGISMAKYDFISYLPSDDYYFENHLESIYEKIRENSHIMLVYTGMKYDSRDTMYFTDDIQSNGARKGHCLQLVQTSHKRTEKRWLERNEWVTDDLFTMFWGKLIDLGFFCSTNLITCYWTNHPAQRHRIINENLGGGLNKYRSYYKVRVPIKMRIAKYKFIDEEKFYANYRKEHSLSESSLKILIVGELAYSPERIYALEEAGHKLYGLWMPDPSFCFSMVGPLPFGHVEDVSLDNWIEKVKEIQPDVIYAMLNFTSVSFAYDVMKTCPHIPFVWHFKEGPSISLRQGDWGKLIYLYTHASGRIFLNDVVKRWFEQFLPPVAGASLVMDGDLPKRDYFKTDFSPKLSEKDGAIHTVIAGRMIGISGNDLAILAQNNVHIHLYTENYFDDRARENIHRFQIAPDHFHVHAHVAADNWTKELSQYDAGWLHCLHSENNGSLLKAGWDDMNIPVRINTYMAAGLPVILYNNMNHIVATQYIVQQFDIGVLFNDYIELSYKLKDLNRMNILRNNVLKNRDWFSFDYHVPELVSLFRRAIAVKFCDFETGSLEKKQLDYCFEELLERQRMIQTDLELQLKEREAEIVHLRNLNLGYVLSTTLIYKRLCDLCDCNRKNPDRMRKLTIQEWELLISEIDSVTLGFVERLRSKYERLLEEDIHFCCLVKLGFKYSDIAYIWGCIAVAVHKRSKSILKKMELEANIKLNDVLREL